MKILFLVASLTAGGLLCASCSVLPEGMGSWSPLHLLDTQQIDANMPEKVAFADVNTARDNYRKAIQGRQRKKTAYLQPINKKEACLAPNIDLGNELAAHPTLYWDGECKNGYASGLGRIITVSAENHYESIIDLKDSTDVDAGTFPFIYRNFRQKVTFRGIVTPDSSYGLFERAAWDDDEARGFYQVTRAYNSFDEQYAEFTFHNRTVITATSFGVRYQRVFQPQSTGHEPVVSDLVSPETMIGFEDDRKNLLYNPARYLIEGEYQTAIVQHGQKYPFHIIGQENWRRVDEVIQKAVSDIERLNMVLDREVIQGLEGRYDAKLAAQRVAPAGIDPELYFAINRYYAKDVNSKLFEEPSSTTEAVSVRSRVGQQVWNAALEEANILQQVLPLANQ